MIQINKQLIIKLSTWWLPRTSGYSYPRVAAIQIDVHLAGETPTNMTRMLPMSVHVCPTYASLGWSPYVVTFHETLTDLDRFHFSGEKGSRHNPLHASWPIRESIPSFSPEPANEAGGVRQTSVGDQLLGLPGPYHWHTIGTFNTCSLGPTHQSFTDIDGVTALEVPAFHIALPDLSNQLSPISPKDPARSLIIHTTFTNWIRDGTSLKSHEWEPPLDFYRNLSSKHSMS
jgi:hypothetical protein